MLTVRRGKRNTKSRFDQGLTIRGWGVVASIMMLGLMGTSVLAQTPILLEDTKLLASDGAAEDQFGRSVAISGDVAIVGAPFHDDNGSFSGSAYVYRFDGISWVEEQKLFASDGAASGLFGISVAISGDLAIVGALTGDGVVANSGSAYVYRFDGISWVEEQKLFASDGAAFVRFGLSVAISGDLAIVGARFGDGIVANSGSAYVYRFDGISWVEEQKLLASDGACNDHFGISVAISGDVAIVGAFLSSSTGQFGFPLDGHGSAYVYRFGGAGWVQEQKLLASDGAAFDRFGISVAVSGDVAIVGAFRDDDDGIDSGSAYVYRLDGVSWVQEQKLLASDGAADDQFGLSVVISGDVAIVGAPLDDDARGINNGSASGSAYVYRFDGISWVEELKLLASDGAAFDAFGISVGISGDVAIVGAFSRSSSGSGSAYVFDLGILEAIDLLLDLIETVIELNLQQGIENSLDAKLDAVLQALTDQNQNNNVAILNALNAFITQVQNQSGNQITEAQAALLVGDAREIIALLSS